MGMGKRVSFQYAQIQITLYPSSTAGRLPMESTYIYSWNNKHEIGINFPYSSKNVRLQNYTWEKDTGLKVEGDMRRRSGVRVCKASGHAQNQGFIINIKHRYCFVSSVSNKVVWLLSHLCLSYLLCSVIYTTGQIFYIYIVSFQLEHDKYCGCLGIKFSTTTRER